MDPAEVHDAAFNMVVALWEGLSPFQRIAFILWSLLVGTKVEPGLAQAIRFMPRLGTESWRRFFLAQKGRWGAYWQMISRPARARYRILDRRLLDTTLSMPLRTEE
jgi:hypothetical protein